jgi:hypothetical protein
MPDGLGIIATRQGVGTLFSTRKPLGAGQSVTSQPFESAGYGQIVTSIISDQPHSVVAEEANRPEGPWTPVSSISSAPIGLVQRAAGRLQPIGCFMRITLQNLAGVPMSSLSAVVFGTAT